MPQKRYRVVLFLSLLLTFALVLSACGNDQAAPVVEESAVVEPTIAAETDVEADEATAEEITAESEVLTETVDTETVDSSAIATDTVSGDVEIITDTLLITGTEVMTSVDVITDVIVLEQQFVTTVVTSTDLVTDVNTLTDQDTITETDFVTETEDVSPTTQTAGAVGSVDVVQLTATPLPSPTPSPMPTATPTVLVEVTAVVTATVEVTEVVTQTVTDTELVTDTVALDVTPTPASATITATAAVTATETMTETGDVSAAAVVFVGVVDAENRIVRASELLGSNVNDFNQEDVGELSDLIVNLSNGRIVFATLASGGFLGLGEETYPVPLSALRYLADTDELAINIDEAQLTDTPGFTGDWPDVTNPRYDVEVEQFWRNLGSDVVPNRMASGVRSVSGTVARASNLLNSDIFTPEGENLGNLDDMLIDLGSGEVRYVVLSIGGFLGLGEELRAIPLSAFDLDTRGVFDDTAAATLILGVDQAVLEQSPTFDPNAYPDTTTPDWDAEWRQFWEENF